jgi:ABC-type amino acid transport substrate-binding protein
MKSKILRCSYVVYEPYFMIDPNTQEKSGIFYETTELIAKKLGLKVEWNSETTFANLEPELNQDKADMFCGGLWEDSQRAQIVQYSEALSYAPVFAYIRGSTEMKDVATLDDIRTKKLRIAFIDGEMSHVIYRRMFADNPSLSLPNTSPESLVAEDIAAGKADVTFIEPAVANAYLAKNPGKFRLVNHTPIQIFSNAYAVKRGETQLLDLFNVAIHSGLNSGEIQEITKKYIHSPDEILMPTVPYQMP